MARKKVEPIISLGNDEDKLLVQKSRPLFALWQSDLTLAEFKILDTYLSRIDSHKPDKRSVIFEKGELEKILCLKQIKPDVLDERLKHLMTTVKIEDNKVKKGFTRIALFEKAIAEQDDDGIWKAELTCTQSAMRYIFNMDSLGYLRYKLRCITSIASRYTYILFVYLESNRRMHLEWQVDLEELKNILNCKAERYDAFKFFNSEILKKIQKEMHEKTECRFTYEPIKKGRSVSAIKFTLESKCDFEEKCPSQLSLFDEPDKNLERDNICAGFSHEAFAEFTPEQLDLLKAWAWSKKRDSDVRKHNELLGNFELACQHATSDYLINAIKMAKLRKAKNIFLYVKAMLEND